MIYFSPVDGSDPNMTNDTLFCTTEGEYLNYDTPVLILSTGMDYIPSNQFYPACAPEEVSNIRFFDAMIGQVWMINATEYGHMDLVDADSIWYPVDETFHVCPGNGNTTDVYRSYVGGQTVAFMDGRISFYHINEYKIKSSSF